MTKNEKVQLVISSIIVVGGVLAMITAGNDELAFILWLPHIWWVIMMTKFLTVKVPNKNRMSGAVLTVIIGFVLYFGSGVVIAIILKLLNIRGL